MAQRAKAKRGNRARLPIPIATKILLATAAGGRCEFAGCRKFLFAHPLTLRDGNFSEHAHIHAFSLDGPRGKSKGRPKNIDDISNLMLLCAACHKLIDDSPDEYPVAALKQQKAAHEERIHYLTGLGPEMRTTVVQLKTKISGQTVDIPLADVVGAVAPRYPADRKGHVIDLTPISDHSDRFVELAMTQIRAEVEAIYRPGMDAERTRHISLFALAPIPLLVFLGRQMSNKIPVDLFQRHRGVDSPWAWKTTGPPARFEMKPHRVLRDSARAALVLPLSGPIDLAKLPATVDAASSIYAIELVDQPPGLDVLNQRSDLEAFRICYRATLAAMRAAMPGMKEILLFPAVPAPVAIACGHDLLPKVDPEMRVYDFDKAQGGFVLRLIV